MGQEIYQVTYHFQQDTVRVKADIPTFSNVLIVENLSNRQVYLELDSSRSSAIRALIPLPINITLQPHEKKSFPVKYLADRQTLKGKVQPFLVTYLPKDSSVSSPTSVSFYTDYENINSLILSTDRTEYYLDRTSQQVQLILRASNRGPIPVTFRIQGQQIQQGIELMGDDRIAITLDPGDQLAMPFTVSVFSKEKSIDANLILQATDLEGNSLAIRRVRIMSVGSIKQFGSDGLSNMISPNNIIGARYLSMDQYQNIAQLYGNGQLDFQKGKSLAYRFNLDYYANFKAINMYDSYLDYQQEKWGVKLGNIYENLDYPMNGRGIKATYKIDQDRSVHVYGLDNSYFFVNQLTQLNPRTKMVAASYEFDQNKKNSGRISYLYARDAYRGVNANQASGRGQLWTSEQGRLDIEGGLSHETSLANSSKTGVSAGVNYERILGEYQLTSNNYFSTPFYSGLRRGVIHSDNRLSKALQGNTNIWLRTSYLDNNPKYQSSERILFLRNRRMIQLYEFGFRRPLGWFDLNLRPYWMFQTFKAEGTIPQLYMGDSWASEAIRMVADIGFYHSAHRFSINSDYGWVYHFTSQTPKAPFHSLRLNINYSNRYVGLYAFLQVNPYYLSDMLATSLEKPDYRMLSVGPNTQFDVFSGRLNVQASAMYNYYGFSRSKNISFYANAVWNMTNNWKLTANLNYSRMQTNISYLYYDSSIALDNYFDNRQIRIGLEKHFAKLGNASNHRLRLFFFEDINNNSIQDHDEPSLPGIIVRIGKETARTNEKGRAEFGNMPTDSYTVLTESVQGWSLPSTMQIVLSKNTTMRVPLIRAKTLAGRIVPLSTKYNNTKPELSGITVIAVSKQGQEYKTLSDQEGRYTFYLPSGSYIIDIPTQGMNFSINNPKREVSITNQQNMKIEDFEYVDQRRKINVKRF